jgi:hypothetical protein
VELLKKASTPRVKDILRANTSEAREAGLCGVPSYRVSEKRGGDWAVCGGIVWGQDELGVVQDLVDGWKEEEAGLSHMMADVSPAHRLRVSTPASDVKGKTPYKSLL